MHTELLDLHGSELSVSKCMCSLWLSSSTQSGAGHLNAWSSPQNRSGSWRPRGRRGGGGGGGGAAVCHCVNCLALTLLESRGVEGRIISRYELDRRRRRRRDQNSIIEFLSWALRLGEGRREQEDRVRASDPLKKRVLQVYKSEFIKNHNTI